MRGHPEILVVLIGLIGCTDGSRGLDPGPTAADTGFEDAAVVVMDARPADAGAPARDAAATDAAPEPMDAEPLDAEPLDAPDAGLLGQVGDACEQNVECASSDSPNADLYPSPCYQEWPGGYCVDYCQLPPGALEGSTLPRSDCPENAVCLPRYDEQIPIGAERPEVGGCFKECTSDEDCRDDGSFNGDYFCRREFWFPPTGTRTFDNGYCAPPHCRSRGCPQSFICGC